MEEITGFSAQVKKRIVKNKFLQPITTTSSKPITASLKTAAMPMRPAAMPMRPAAMPMRPAAMPMRPAAMPMRPAAMPMRPAAISPVKMTVKTLVPQIIPAAQMPLRLATVKPTVITEVKSISPVSMPVKSEIIQPFKTASVIKSEEIKAQKKEIKEAQEIQNNIEKPKNNTLIIGGSIAAIAALYFLTKKRKK